jgi:hypothetical protein
MMPRFRLITMAAIAATVVPLQAATLLEQRDAESHTIMYIDGVQMRAETPGQPGYMLMNFEAGTMYMVSPEEKTVIDNSAMLKAMREQKPQSTGRQPSVRFQHMGPGPIIAGYKTEHFAEYVDDTHCADIFLSKDALDDSGFSEFMDAMESGVMNSDEEESSPCDWGSVEGFSLVRKHGYPLRELDADGTLNNEVIRIQTDAAVPEGGFELPAGYQVITMEQMMQGMGGMAMPGASGGSGVEEYLEQIELPEGMQDEEALEKVKSLLDSMKDRGN